MLPSLHRLPQPASTAAPRTRSMTKNDDFYDNYYAKLPDPMRKALLPETLQDLPEDIKKTILTLIEGNPVDLCFSGLQRACANAMRQRVPNVTLQSACNEQFWRLCRTGIDDPNDAQQMAVPYVCNFDIQNFYDSGEIVYNAGGDYNPYDTTGWNDAEHWYRWVRQFGLFCAIEHGTPQLTDDERMDALQALRLFGDSRLTHILPATFRRIAAVDIDKLPDSITRIGGRAFQGCTGIWRMRLPDALQSIGHAAFTDCTNLRRIHLPDGLVDIDVWAFADCTSLKEIALPPAVIDVSEHLFDGCTSLERVYLSPQTRSFGADAFANCTALRGVVLPDSVRHLQYNTFRNCHPDLMLVYEGVAYRANDPNGVYPRVMRQRS